MKATAFLLALVFATSANATNKIPDVMYQSWDNAPGTLTAPNGKECPVPKEVKKFGVVGRCINGHKVQLVSFGVDNNCKLDWIEVRDLGTPLECAL